ncbi:UNVERIFIED_CONTAM: hypothetical protein K2H54_001630 [Gekko kuhli]
MGAVKGQLLQVFTACRRESPSGTKSTTDCLRTHSKRQGHRIQGPGGGGVYFGAGPHLPNDQPSAMLWERPPLHRAKGPGSVVPAASVPPADGYMVPPPTWGWPPPRSGAEAKAAAAAAQLSAWNAHPRQTDRSRGARLPNPPPPPSPARCPELALLPQVGEGPTLPASRQAEQLAFSP